MENELLLTIIIESGKGSAVLNFMREMGIRNAICLLGKGVIQNKFLEMMEINEVYKEIILAPIPFKLRDELLDRLKTRFHLEKKNHGMAFLVPLAGALQDAAMHWDTSGLSSAVICDYTAILLIVDKSRQEIATEICHRAGYYGGIAIKAHGSASKLNIVLDRMVEPEKEVMLMLLQTRLADRLTAILNEQLQLDKPNTGILIRMGVNQVLGYVPE
ncbi:MAG: hypothetical protein E7255_03580 [Lachnospiraceae bacterium]|jgi:hypothetical protein|nr:hypothetical protein [Lachnospiraceae bacterium]